MLHNLHIQVQVSDAGELELPPLPGLAPGKYDAVLVLSKLEAAADDARPPLNLPVVDLVPISPSETFRREDIYEDTMILRDTDRALN
jgi:hypothetical protein